MTFYQSFCKVFSSLIILGSIIYLVKKIKTSNKKCLTKTKDEPRILKAIERFNDKCPLCPSNLTTHSFRTCPKFTELKAATSKDMYHSDQLLEVDEKGFCAAGILPYCSIEGIKYIFLTKEKRKTALGEQFLLNFACGKRDSLIDETLTTKEGTMFGHNNAALYRFETSKETAYFEFEEEVKPLMNEYDFRIFQNNLNYKICFDNLIVWIPKSKAVLYLVEVASLCQNCCCIPKPDSDEAISFEWVNISEMDFNTAHEFVRPTLKYVRGMMAELP
jgi:hypothetical protein